MNAEIDQFVLYLATERGLSDNYQLSTRSSLELFAHWSGEAGRGAVWSAVTPEQIGEFLGWRKKGGAAAATLLFRWLAPAATARAADVVTPHDEGRQ